MSFTVGVTFELSPKAVIPHGRKMACSYIQGTWIYNYHVLCWINRTPRTQLEELDGLSSIMSDLGQGIYMCVCLLYIALQNSLSYLFFNVSVQVL